MTNDEELTTNDIIDGIRISAEAGEVNEVENSDEADLVINYLVLASN